MRAEFSRLLPLMMEAARRPFEGTVLTLGRMNLHFGHGNVVQAARDFGVTLAEADVEVSPFPSAARIGGISDRSYFRLLGFSDSKVLDLAECEMPDYRLDLNGDMPAEFSERFDCIIDPGTVEHVFDAARALRGMAGMVRPGGRIIHLSAPASNDIDHGFYCFSPSFFHDFYAANGFDINAIYLVRILYGRMQSTWDLYAYQPGALRHVHGGDLPRGHWMTFCVVTRRPGSTADRIPQQDRGAFGWGVDRAGTPPSPQAPAARILRRVRRALFRRPPLGLRHERRFVTSGKLQ